MLSQSILDLAVKKDGEKGWKLSDVPEVAKDALKNNMGIIGGQIQYRLPRGTCELYWVNADPESKKENESWEEYVLRSYEEFLLKFKENVLSRDIQKEAIESFQFLKEKVEKGMDIEPYQVFLMYFSEGN